MKAVKRHRSKTFHGRFCMRKILPIKRVFGALSVIFLFASTSKAVMLCLGDDQPDKRLPGVRSLYNDVDFSKGFRCQGLDRHASFFDFGSFQESGNFMVGSMLRLVFKGSVYSMKTSPGLNKISCPKNARMDSVLSPGVVRCNVEAHEQDSRFSLLGGLDIYTSNPLRDSRDTVTFRANWSSAKNKNVDYLMECTFYLKAL